MAWKRLVIAAWCVGSGACAGSLVRPALTPSKPATEAVLVLPGFGYGHSGEQAFRSLAPSMAKDGFDLYVPKFVARSGLTESRERLRQFIRSNHLARYSRVHVFAFIAGGWTFNPMADADLLPNLATIVYDRSPFQERAPRIAMEKLRLLAWVKYGPVVFDVAKTPYAPLRASDVKVGLVVETTPTSFIRHHADDARRQGPYDFGCDAFRQRYDDCAYVAMNHNELYTGFAAVWPDVRTFITTGHFTASANRTPPARGLEVADRD
jgi:hypothetical protein